MSSFPQRSDFMIPPSIFFFLENFCILYIQTQLWPQIWWRVKSTPIIQGIWHKEPPHTSLKGQKNDHSFCLFAVWSTEEWKETCKWLLCDVPSDVGRWEVIMRNVTLCLLFWGEFMVCYYDTWSDNCSVRRRHSDKKQRLSAGYSWSRMAGTVTGAPMCVGDKTDSKRNIGTITLIRKKKLQWSQISTNMSNDR